MYLCFPDFSLEEAKVKSPLTSVLPLADFLRFSTLSFPNSGPPWRSITFARSFATIFGDPMDPSRSVDQCLDDPTFMVDDHAFPGFEMGIESHQYAPSYSALNSFEKIEVGFLLHAGGFKWGASSGRRLYAISLSIWAAFVG
jgi:hypothetical protein